MELLRRKLPLVDAMLKGMGQIMFQENALTGLLFLAAIFYNGATMGLAAVLAVFCGTLTAKIFRYDEAETQQGLYGFSAALVGVALTFYYQPVLIVWVAIVVGATLATILQHLFIVKRIPVFTFPFVLVTWVMIYLINYVHPVSPSLFLTAKIPATNYLSSIINGFGQVIFQNGLFAGLLFFIAILINSPISTLYGFAGALAGALLSYLLAVPLVGIEMGLFGYNAVLCAIAFAGVKVENVLWALLAVVLSVFINILMVHNNFIVLTFPFVAACCITLFLKKYIWSRFLSRSK